MCALPTLRITSLFPRVAACFTAAQFAMRTIGHWILPGLAGLAWLASWLPAAARYIRLHIRCIM